MILMPKNLAAVLHMIVNQVSVFFVNLVPLGCGCSHHSKKSKKAKKSKKSKKCKSKSPCSCHESSSGSDCIDFYLDGHKKSKKTHNEWKDSPGVDGPFFGVGKGVRGCSCDSSHSSLSSCSSRRSSSSSSSSSSSHSCSCSDDNHGISNNGFNGIGYGFNTDPITGFDLVNPYAGFDFHEKRGRKHIKSRSSSSSSSSSCHSAHSVSGRGVPRLRIEDQLRNLPCRFKRPNQIHEHGATGKGCGEIQNDCDVVRATQTTELKDIPDMYKANIGVSNKWDNQIQAEKECCDGKKIKSFDI